jgi:tRNA pseudouridine32 synthase/23S rRNA pseudouridine746 synthase
MQLKAITDADLLDRVLYRDGLMLVVDKPAGVPVHRGPKGGGSLEDHFDALRFGLPRPPALAHRLDKDTSGCLVLGRHRKALAHLGLLFKHGKVGKTYWAMVEGGPDADEGTIDLPLGRLDEERGWWMKPDPHGLQSVTTWKVLGRSAAGAVTGASAVDHPPLQGEGRTAEGRPGWGRGGAADDGRVEDDNSAACTKALAPPPGLLDRGRLRPAPVRQSDLPPPRGGDKRFTWLALTPVTGRTHQLRVHCAASGWPIVGDAIYGNAPRFTGPPQMLHAREVVVPISKNKPPIRVVAPVPDHMRDALRACGWNGGRGGLE